VEQFKGTTDTDGRVLFLDPTHKFRPSAYWWTFAPDADATCTPISVLKGWEEQGFAAFSRTGIYRLDTRNAAEDNWILEIPEAHTAAAVRIDGREVGRRAWRPYRFVLDDLTKGTYELESAVSNTAANRYYDRTPNLGGTLDKRSDGCAAPCPTHARELTPPCCNTPPSP
jgi:hypothetical protein